MIPAFQLNKRRQAWFIEYFNLLLNVICNTLLTVKYCKEAYERLKKEADTNGSSVVRKRCRALMTKMSAPVLGSQRIAKATGCSLNFVSALINAYNNEGIDAVLRIYPRSGRPSRMDGHLEEIVRKPEEHPVRSMAEAAHIIHHRIHFRSHLDQGDAQTLWLPFQETAAGSMQGGSSEAEGMGV
ncbi:MAG: helix-turn-helix domain-containing protein [Muribaculaceae bacterium]|nr:helix-turn-helix domain-containing protein [Muribaculaceae bacterium]